MTSAADLEKVEIDLLLDAVKHRYGYDFSHYARASLKRRLMHRLRLSELTHLSDMLPRILRDEAFFNQVLMDLSITVTEMFRDPQVYRAIRDDVFPILRTYPLVKIWHAGCATGEEVYSLALLLEEAGIYDKAHIYATDYNRRALQIARMGQYPPEDVRQYAGNYLRAGGRSSLTDHFRIEGGSARIEEGLKRNITFAHHNLVTDGSFGEMVLIVCRNVLIYFDSSLKEHVLSLFRESLHPLGFLCLGPKESLHHTRLQEGFGELVPRTRIYRRLPARAGGR